MADELNAPGSIESGIQEGTEETSFTEDDGLEPFEPEQTEDPDAAIPNSADGYTYEPRAGDPDIDETIMTGFKSFCRKEGISQGLFRRIVAFQLQAARNHVAALAKASAASSMASQRASRPPQANGLAAEKAKILRSEAYNKKSHPNHKKAVMRMVHLCQRSNQAD